MTDSQLRDTVRLSVVPITIGAAKEYVSRCHRHHEPPRGALFAVACQVIGAVEPCGVGIVGRPVARRLQDGLTCEVLRVATDGTRNACSVLLGACKRIAKALGYVRCITYTLAEESGASLRAVGAVPTATVKGASWDTSSRPRVDKGNAQRKDKVRWDLFSTTRNEEGTP